MESLPNLPLLHFNQNTLHEVRKEINLDTTQRVEEAINILDDWVKKQSHFEKKDFPRAYLERTIITTKGLLERAKVRLDKYCTFKSTMPEFFVHDDLEESYKIWKKITIHAHMPKLTKENYRVHFQKLISSEGDSVTLFKFFKYLLVIGEYLKIYDYAAGYINIIDLSEAAIMKLASKINIVELRQLFTILIEGYGLRLKGIHLITSSKTIDSFVSILKSVLSEKIGKRIHVHKTLDSLYEFVDKDCLPAEYGGKQKSITDLQEEWFKTLSGKEFQNILKELDKAKINEAYRQSVKFNAEYIGMPGSFRTLVVD